MKNSTSKQAKLVVHSDIRSKWESGKTLDHCYNAEIDAKGGTIRLFGTYISYNHKNSGNKEVVSFDRTFKIGDVVEYGSYNLHYMGTITKISANTVEVDTNGTYDQMNDVDIKRMKLAEFSRRNHDLDLVQIAKSNYETSQCI